MYVKTQWVDNTTPIDSTNMNKIEQGIYDNSLVSDAVNATVKPSESALAEPVEITEGQITDVLGVNEIKLKGDTVQDGTPTPSAPVDVNVVSGSNIINISNKNLLDISVLTTRTIANVNVTNNGDGSFTLNGTSNSSGGAVDVSIDIPLKKNTTYTFSKVNNMSGASYSLSLRDNSNVAINGTSIDSSEKSINFTLQSNIVAKYFRLYFAPNKTFTNHTIYPMLEINSTATPFTEHQGKELPLDLPVENLFVLPEAETKNGIAYSINEDGTINIEGTATSTTYFSRYVNLTNINLKNGGAYTLSSNMPISTGLEFRLEAFNENDWIRHVITPINNTSQKNTKNSINLSDANSIRISIVINNGTTINVSNIGVQVEKGLNQNRFTPYGTDPIELCKIGDYQDYFYRDNGKWYLHKEIEKKTFNGSENWEDRPNYTNADRFVLGDSTIPIQPINGYSKYFVVYKALIDEMGILENNGAQILINFSTKGSTTLEQFKEWLSTHNTSIYYVLASATNTEITDTTLKAQLEAIGNAPLYEQTNITQENNDLPIILDITAFKDNINGIKAWIRK